jgi:hypothetical protein
MHAATCPQPPPHTHTHTESAWREQEVKKSCLRRVQWEKCCVVLGGGGARVRSAHVRTCVRCTRRLTCPLLPNVNLASGRPAGIPVQLPVPSTSTPSIAPKSPKKGPFPNSVPTAAYCFAPVEYW